MSTLPIATTTTSSMVPHIRKLLDVTNEEHARIILQDYIEKPSPGDLKFVLRNWAKLEKGNKLAAAVYSASLEVFKPFDEVCHVANEEGLSISRNWLDLVSLRPIDSFFNQEQFVLFDESIDDLDAKTFILECIQSGRVDVSRFGSTPWERLYSLANLYTQAHFLEIPHLIRDCSIEMARICKGNYGLVFLLSEHYLVTYNVAVIDWILGFHYQHLIPAKVDMSNAELELVFDLLIKRAEIKEVPSEPDLSKLKVALQNSEIAILNGVEQDAERHKDQCGWTLRFAAREKLTQELCMAVVRRNGRALQWVPQEMRTEALCRVAIEHGGHLDHVPNKLRDTLAECKALRKNAQNKYLIVTIEGQIKLQNFEEVAIEDNLSWKDSLDEFAKGPYWSAVEKDCFALKNVPVDMRTEALCMLAVTQERKDFQTGKHVMKYVPESMKTEKLCWAAIKTSCFAVKYLPEDQPMEDIYLYVVNCQFAFFWIPENKRTEAIYAAAVKIGTYTLEEVPGHMRTEKIYHAAVVRRCIKLHSVPVSMRTIETCKEAMKHDHLAWFLFLKNCDTTYCRNNY